MSVALPARNLPQRRRDLDRREGAGCDLVDERLEEVEVLAVDERHLDVGAAEAADRQQAAEAAAHDDDPRHARIAPSSCSSFSFVEPAGVAGQRPVRAEHPVARQHDRDRVAVHHRAHGARRPRAPDLAASAPYVVVIPYGTRASSSAPAR